jgi:hypothetical protein
VLGSAVVGVFCVDIYFICHGYFSVYMVFKPYV